MGLELVLARQPGLEVELGQRALEPQELEPRELERERQLELRGLWEPVGQPVQVQELVPEPVELEQVQERQLEPVELEQVQERQLEPVERPVWRWERLEALESLERPVWRWAPRGPECLALH